MKMGPDCIICSRVCFYRGITVKSENWRALITVGLPGRTLALQWEAKVGWGAIRGWVSVTEGARMNREEGWRGRTMGGGGHGESLARPQEGEANRRSRWTPLCNLFPFASASRTNVGSTGGSPRSTRPDEPIPYYHHRLSSANHPRRKSGENFKKIAGYDKSCWHSRTASGTESNVKCLIQALFWSQNSIKRQFRRLKC